MKLQVDKMSNRQNGKASSQFKMLNKMANFKKQLDKRDS